MAEVYDVPSVVRRLYKLLTDLSAESPYIEDGIKIPKWSLDLLVMLDDSDLKISREIKDGPTMISTTRVGKLSEEERKSYSILLDPFMSLASDIADKHPDQLLATVGLLRLVGFFWANGQLKFKGEFNINFPMIITLGGISGSVSKILSGVGDEIVTSMWRINQSNTKRLFKMVDRARDKIRSLDMYRAIIYMIFIRFIYDFRYLGNLLARPFILLHYFFVKRSYVRKAKKFTGDFLKTFEE